MRGKGKKSHKVHTSKQNETNVKIELDSPFRLSSTIPIAFYCHYTDNKHFHVFFFRFPRYRSHYSRRDNPRKEYIQAVHSVAEMYRMYCKEISPKKPQSLDRYRRVFNTEYNIGFKLPCEDTCRVCDGYQNDPDNPQFILHKRRAQAAYDMYTKNKEDSSLDDSDTVVITMDLEQALPTPHIRTETVFYLRQLWTYNFGVHVCNNNHGIMCVWGEHVASRGADEIVSCLMKVMPHLESYNKDHLIVWSDSCYGQNKNFSVMCFWQYVLQTTNFKKVTHRFFVPGHSFMASDSDFALVEKRKKFETVYTCEQWADVIKTAKVKNPFHVTYMTKEDFLDFTNLTSSFTNRKKTEDGENFLISRMSMMMHDASKPGIIGTSYTYSGMADGSMSISVNKRGRDPNLKAIKFSEKYPNGRKIKEAKLKDLKKMMPFIPPVYQSFFANLQGDGSTDVVEEMDDENDVSVV